MRTLAATSSTKSFPPTSEYPRANLFISPPPLPPLPTATAPPPSTCSTSPTLPLSRKPQRLISTSPPASKTPPPSFSSAVATNAVTSGMASSPASSSHPKPCPRNASSFPIPPTRQLACWTGASKAPTANVPPPSPLGYDDQPPNPLQAPRA